jgi:N-sulfoglucosamine sulfohydrolase
MKRRDFVKVAAGTAAISSLSGVFNIQAAGGSSPRPNIFMIFTDDTTQRDHGCYGNSHVRTPNIDRFAQEGMLFENMITPAPMCGPSRAALYTGLNPIRNGAHPNHSSCRPGTKSMAHYMKSLGYRVVLLGKQHIKPEESFPFEYRDEILGHRKHGKEIEGILADPGDKPLCIIMNHFETHWSFDHGQDEYPYNPDEVEIPPYLVDTPETREQRARYFSEITFMDNAVGNVLKLLRDTGMEENTLTIYASDHGSHWPREKWNMYDSGIKLPFIVRWPGEIKPGTRTEALASIVDIVPTFIDIAGGDVGRVVEKCGGEALDGKSLLPVMLGETDDVQQEIYAVMTYGVTTVYPMRAIRTKTHKYIWNIDSHFEFPDYWATKLPRREKHEWIVWKSWLKKAQTDPVAAELIKADLHRPPVELYDLRADPHELYNLAGDPTNKELLSELRKKLDAWMVQQGDDGSSSYHLEEGLEPKHIDRVWSRQEVVNIDLAAYGKGIAFTDRTTVSLSSPVWKADIHYTLDGSDPTRDSQRFTKPFIIDPPVIIRARGFWDEKETAIKTLNFREHGFRVHYKDHYEPLHDG